MAWSPRPHQQLRSVRFVRGAAPSRTAQPSESFRRGGGFRKALCRSRQPASSTALAFDRGGAGRLSAGAPGLLKASGAAMAQHPAGPISYPSHLSPAPCASCWPNRGRSGVMRAGKGGLNGRGASRPSRPLNPAHLAPHSRPSVPLTLTQLPLWPCTAVTSDHPDLPRTLPSPPQPQSCCCAPHPPTHLAMPRPQPPLPPRPPRPRTLPAMPCLPPPLCAPPTATVAVSPPPHTAHHRLRGHHGRLLHSCTTTHPRSRHAFCFLHSSLPQHMQINRHLVRSDWLCPSFLITAMETDSRKEELLPPQNQPESAIGSDCSQRPDSQDSHSPASQTMRAERKLSLKTNMRSEDSAYSELLVKLGDGKLDISFHLGMDIIEIPHEMICNGSIIEATFGNSIPIDNTKNISKRVILCPKNEHVQKLSEEILDILDGDVHTYLSDDSIDSTDDAGNENFPIEFLNSITPSGMPCHKLKLKVGAIIMLLRILIVSGVFVMVLDLLSKDYDLT
ncbi:hypothetical protein QTO34_016968 [Cnephaeus nilssonii]|uniref:DNA helicase Pif1-like 2B domain-containing protein n=1 Tax=Cnephaeus nilssonii TaxID=3371016 RepID=A0AA40LQT4_CNENI|nr:hypothetical protein QTO34_016968 [Eptesicus nilssonii]